MLRIDRLRRVDAGGQRADLDAHGAEHGNVGDQGTLSDAADVVDRCYFFHVYRFRKIHVSHVRLENARHQLASTSVGQCTPT